MKLHYWIAATLFAAGTALAQTEQPEQVYAKLHKATLAGNAEEMMSYATAAQARELKNMPGRDAQVKMLSGLMPKSYTVNSRTFNPDGKTARLIASGMGEFMGSHSMMYGTVNFIREDGQWKVDKWEWGNQKPAAFPVSAAAEKPAAAAAPASPIPAAAAATPAAQAASAPKEMSKLERQEARRKAREEAEAKRIAAAKAKEEADRKAFAERWKNCEIKPVMSDEDLRKCGASPKSN